MRTQERVSENSRMEGRVRSLRPGGIPRRLPEESRVELGLANGALLLGKDQGPPQRGGMEGAETTKAFDGQGAFLRLELRLIMGNWGR